MNHATVLSIAGSDSGGGAGLQADLAACAYWGVHGTTAVTAVTAQNPHEVQGVFPLAATEVEAQIEAVFADFSVGAVKTGMLFSDSICIAVGRCLQRHAPAHVVIDPVMVATSGARLLRDDAVAALRTAVLPLATLITPNVPEAEILLGRSLGDRNERRRAAAVLADTFRAWVLIKGGHDDGDTACDILSDGHAVWRLSSPREACITTHGTGCSLSAAAAAVLALGADPLEAVLRAKAYVLGRLRHTVALGPETWGQAPPVSLPLDDIEVESE